MKPLFERTHRFLESPLGAGPRGLLVVAAVLLIPVYLFPLWKMTMFAPQYPDGLRLSIYSYKLEGGNQGQDIKEINVLNHYIGMKDLSAADFTEFQWIPFVVGALALLLLRSAALGTMTSLVDMVVLFLYFGLFALWSFAYKLYLYGHNLAPTAAVKVPPFTPPVMGSKQLANFEVYSFPGIATYALAAVALVLAGSLLLAWREARREVFDATRVAG
jgi:hypothetical protein